MTHPFDRYAAFTDLAALKQASDKPLRKSIRVNTLKTIPEKVLTWGKEQGWEMTQVPWCKEGFFVDRENREHALGKDLLHLLGHVYMQEAASMLPVELLDPQPGEHILDMSAAPGSKSTQIAAKMQEKGILLCNDMQEKRLWTLKNALHRSGVVNAIVTKKVGQWFAKQMTERFERVLCDAPCTAQGTSRKDSDALDYCSLENIGKMAKLQRELLEAAVHATCVGGRIVYSTCTLTPEENEEVICSIMNKFSDQLECLMPAVPMGLDAKALEQGIMDSLHIQKSLGWDKTYPMVRLWPQTYDTEGFFCAVLQKKSSTRHREKFDPVRYQEEELPRARMHDIGKIVQEHYGTSFLHENDRLFVRNDQLLLATQEVTEYRLPISDYSLGLPFALRLDGNRLRLDHDIAAFRGIEATNHTLELTDTQLDDLLSGRDTTCPPDCHGDTILLYQKMAVGIGLAKEGKLKNRLPRWIVQKS